jgi:hypothetical protein
MSAVGLASKKASPAYATKPGEDAEEEDEDMEGEKKRKTTR